MWIVTFESFILKLGTFSAEYNFFTVNFQKLPFRENRSVYLFKYEAQGPPSLDAK